MSLSYPEHPRIPGSCDPRDYTPEPQVLRDPWLVLRQVRLRAMVRRVRAARASRIILPAIHWSVILDPNRGAKPEGEKSTP